MNSKVGKDCRFNNCLLRYYLIKNFIGSSFIGSCEELEMMIESMIEDMGKMNKVCELKKNVIKLKKKIEQNAVRIFCARPLIVNDIPNPAAIIRRQ